MHRNRNIVATVIALFLAAGGGYYVARHRLRADCVGSWQLELPAGSGGTGRRLILLSDGTGDLDGTAFHYRVVDDCIVSKYSAKDLYVWPYKVKDGKLTLTAFKATDTYVRVD
ncbi:hypothetical protein [Fimbriimonas ginsengisoli]|uniref:Uncharacterized protein n=1 Tax=Fimbriimonas ginsengisoli Gsoil 348 TaxID=661478 RepID=A0A068NPP8_FIMGI|nr:hypothetical protein [Fimbriimonas ginsengisoli]AIE85421.1 hypothetical protein OP10G_2053 [Fimbriimonas ginsengisoli Gsoil 348]